MYKYIPYYVQLQFFKFYLFSALFIPKNCPNGLFYSFWPKMAYIWDFYYYTGFVAATLNKLYYT